MEFSNPKVTIDLAEYEHLLEIFKEYERDKNASTEQMLKRIIQGLLRYCIMNPNFDLPDVLFRVAEIYDDIKNIQFMEDGSAENPLDQFKILIVKKDPKDENKEIIETI